jgi:hypothetical protein
MVKTMHIARAQIPSTDQSDDRIVVAPHAIAVLDGASAFVPLPVQAASYADALGKRLIDLLATEQHTDLRTLLSNAIGHVAAQLGLRPGHSPSSTVSIVRERGKRVDVLVLGDSPVIVGTREAAHLIVDKRLDQLPTPERDLYRERLTTGSGFDEQHSALLADLQHHQAQYRNRTGGYWIAEADPDAATHANCYSFSRDSVNWVIVATDGAADPLQALGLDDWHALARGERVRNSFLRLFSRLL